VDEQEMAIPTGDGEMTAFVVHPHEGRPLPVALLYMDGVGYRDQVKENARRFAAAGYYCVAPDLFHRAGTGLVFDFGRLSAPGSSDAERERMMRVVSGVRPELVVADIQAVLATISKDRFASAGPKVCVGYCMGARLALHVVAALADQFVAAACIHPGALVTDGPDSPHLDLDRVRGEIYVAFAESDRSATAENVDRLRHEMEARSVRGLVERIPGTAHGFAMADLPVYDREAAERHFEATLELWRRNLAGQPVTA
jgi:carboxymethylenebutenolidase